MFRISLQTFLIACTLAGVGLAFFLRSQEFLLYSRADSLRTANGMVYDVEWFSARDPLGRKTPGVVFIRPVALDTGFSAVHHLDQDINKRPRKLSYQGKELGTGTSRIYVVVKMGDFREVSLSDAALRALSRARAHVMYLRDDLLTLAVWKERVEPQIDAIVAHELRGSMPTFSRGGVARAKGVE